MSQKFVEPITIISILCHQGAAQIWVVFLDRHPVGTIRKLNPTTHKISLIHDVMFLQKSCGEWHNIVNPIFAKFNVEGSNDEDGEQVPESNRINNDYHCISDDSDSDEKVDENIFECNVKEDLEVSPETTLNPNVERAMKNLQTSYNEAAHEIIEQAEQEEKVKF